MGQIIKTKVETANIDSVEERGRKEEWAIHKCKRTRGIE